MSLQHLAEGPLRALVADEVTRVLEAHQTPEPSAGWLNAKTAAVYLDTTEAALRALVRRGQLIAYRSEVGAVRFLREDLDDHARAGE